MDKHSEELVKEYLKFCTGLSSTTLSNYGSSLKVFMDHYTGKTLNWNDLTVDDIISFFEKYKASRNTKIYRITILSRFYAWGVRENHLINNPVKSFLRTLKPDKKEREYLTGRQVEELLRNISDTTYYVFTLFFLKTGVRISEFTRITLNDIDFKDGSILIRGGKGRKERYVFFDTQMDVYLKTWLRERELLSPKCNNLFVNKFGKPLNPPALNTYIKHLNEVSENKINKHVTAHVLRHTFATSCIDKGMDLRTLQDILGHEDIKTTSIYLHKNKESLKREYLRVMGK